MKAKKKGISLIVLVITIIVMIILAAAIIITLANNGIIGRANEAVEGINEAQVREMANLAWAELYLDGEEITAGKIIDYLKANGMTDAELSKYDIKLEGDKVVVTLIGGSKPSGELNEYGFYYNTFYTADVTYNKGTENERVVKYGVVFYEKNNEVALFMDMYNDLSAWTNFSNLKITNPTYLCAGVSEWSYSDGIVSFADPTMPSSTLTAEFDKDGLTAVCSGGPLDGAIGKYSSITVESPKFNQKYKLTWEEDGAIWNLDAYTTMEGSMIGTMTVSDKATGTLIETSAINYEINNLRADNHMATIVIDGENKVLTFTPDGTIGVADAIPVMLTDEIVEFEIVPVEGSSIENIKAGNPKAGDKVIYDGYTYIYNNAYIALFSGWMNTEGVSGYPQNSWGVRVNNVEKEAYPNMVSTLYNIPVKSLDGTFSGCKKLKVAPILSENAETFLHSFYNCEALTKVVIPEKAKNLAHAFMNCKALTDVSEIPSGVTHMHNTFSGCESLVSIKNIPYGVTTLYATFSGCKSLTSCPTIPSTVTDMGSTFDSCENLETAPIIPSSVDNMLFTFADCIKLTGTVTVNANPSDCSLCFTGTTKTITIKGSCSSATKKSLSESSSAGNVKY